MSLSLPARLISIIAVNQALTEVGIDASMWQLVNFREQLAWVHKADKELATQKERREPAGDGGGQIKSTGTRQSARWGPRAKPPGYLVVGGGISGMTAALSLANQGHEVSLVQKTGQLGGQALEMSISNSSPDDSQELLRGQPSMRSPRIRKSAFILIAS